MDTSRDFASKAWLQPADEPRSQVVRLMDALGFVLAAWIGLLAIVFVMSLA